MSWEGPAMTSKISCFDPAVCRRSVKRALPAWVFYALYELLLPLQLYSQWENCTSFDDGVYTELQQTILDFAPINASVVACIFGGLFAWALFHWLFRTNSAYFYAALPVRRETLFLTNYLTGLALFALPALVSSVLLGLVGSAFGAAAFVPAMQVFAATMLGAMLFFSFGVLVCTIVGQMAAAGIVYCILNFAVVLLALIVEHLMETFVYGMPSGSSTIEGLAILGSPVLGINTQFTTAAIYDESWTIRQVFLTGWGYLALLAGVGLLFAAWAFWLLRRREMERSGDVVAVRGLRPVALYLFTIGCALVLGAAFTELIAGSAADNFWYVLLFLLVGAFIGYFSAQMLLQKTLRVFRSGWLGFGVTCAAFAMLFGAVKIDLFGYSHYLPQRGQIVEASLSTSRYSSHLSADAEHIDAVLRLHSAVVDGKQEQEARKADFRLGEDHNETIYFLYSLTDGSVVSREYSLVYTEAEQSNAESLIAQFEAVYSAPSSVRIRLGFDEPRTRADVLAASVQSKETGETTWLDAQQAWQLYEACSRDIDAGLLQPEDTANADYTPLSLAFLVADPDYGKAERTESVHVETDLTRTYSAKETATQTQVLWVDSIPITATQTTKLLSEFGFGLYWSTEG